MAQVSVSINGRSYQIACDDGQEANLARLAGYVDKRVSQLVAAVGQVGQERLLVMASLLVADELSDAVTQLDALRDDEREGAAGQEARLRLVRTIEALASRVENIAERLERT